MKYNLSKIMLKAWKVFRSNKKISFGEALHRAWLSVKAEEVNGKRIDQSKAATGITEETNTYTGWKKAGYEVIHGSKALFHCCLIWGSRGDGATYKSNILWAVPGTAGRIKKSPCGLFGKMEIK